MQLSHRNEEQEMKRFIHRLVVTAATQGCVMGIGFWMLHKMMHGGIAHKPFTIGNKRVLLNGSEASLVDSISDPDSIYDCFSTVGGLKDAKETLHQAVVAPFQYSSLYSRGAGSLRNPPKGVLLYGPPGTGKTLLAKTIAKSCGANFLEVKVENLFGKWLGESEQTVSAIFTLARKIQPCVIFVDELDSLLSTRTGMDAHAYANAKTIFLRQWDGFATSEDTKIVVIGATNCPEVLDPAVLRRLSVKIHIDYPDLADRKEILKILLRHEDTTRVDLTRLAEATSKYSGADLKELCQHACREQIRQSIRTSGIERDVPPQPTVADKVSQWFGVRLPGWSPAAVPPREPVGLPPLTTDMIINCMAVVKSNETFAATLRGIPPKLPSRTTDLD
eukprot:TRINITY_DN800_c0_g1_i2.p1 TRINITY_DN800_c0_g1~~TRINITY_DN800_c0_g1_i2.p1  ORF type:complete len:390 (+),score=58.35 TRINITY_DN800_c0_g1_i2:62-1231(+)